MKTSVDICKRLIREAIIDFLLEHPNLKFCYEYSIDEEIHLIEVSPSIYSSESFIDDFDLSLSKKVSNIDLHQSVVIFPSNDIDFCIEDCELELEGLFYHEDDLRGRVIQSIFKGKGESKDAIIEGERLCDYDYSDAA